jgi:phage-related tail fiber protein
MIDVNSQFFAILTRVGEAKQANADALGIPWNIAQMGVGDANDTNPIPDRLQTKLINERRRAPLNQLMIDPLNPSVLIAEQVIPADVGGWWVREIGLYDSDGDLIAVANCAPSYKSLLSQGSGRTQIVRMNFIISSITNVVLKIDPAIVLATREYVDRSIADVLPANKIAGTYRQVTIDKRGVVQSGSNPTTLAGYGITDALPNNNPLLDGSLDLHGGPYAFVTSTSESSVCQNCYYSGTAWLRHDISKPAVCIALDGGQFYVRRVSAGQNPIAWQTVSPVWDASNAKFSGLLERPTTLAGYSIRDAFTKAETSASIDEAIARLIGSAPGAVDTIEELARALNNNPNFASDVINGLAEKANKATTLAGYNITDAYTKAVMDQTFKSKADKANTLAGYGIGDAYDAATMDRALSDKANKASSLAGYGITDAYTKAIMDQTLKTKADKATTLGGYGISDAIRNSNPLPNGSIDIHGEMYAFVTSPLESSLCQNCFWNGSTWLRHDPTKPAVSIVGASGSALVRSAPAGAGPIVWASVDPIWTSSNATLSSSAGIGTLRLPNGWIQQVFDVTESTGAADYRYFPVSFPTECFGVFPVLTSATPGGYGSNFGMVVGDVTKDRFLISAGGNFSPEGRFRVFALGR